MMFKRLSLFFLFLIINLIASSQTGTKTAIYHNYKFNEDSLNGFDFFETQRQIISENYTNDEVELKLYILKREYINNKYNLNKTQNNKVDNVNSVDVSPVYPRGVSASTPTNADFESSAPGSVTTSSQVNGWSITEGFHLSQTSPYTYTAPNGANACNQMGCCASSVITECRLINAPNGYIDSLLGIGYPIYSVFGTSEGDPNGEFYNPHLNRNLKGNNFLRLNSKFANGNIERASFNFQVDQNNTLFELALLGVIFSGHNCCDAASIRCDIRNVTTNSVLACHSFSYTGPSTQCPALQNTGITFYSIATGSAINTPTSNISNVFNKWEIFAIDLTPYIGQSIRVDITTLDCAANGHYAYCYIDAQTSKKSFLTNNVSNSPVSDTIYVNLCPDYSATLCALPGLGYYQWSYLPQSVSSTMQCNVVTAPGIYTASMINYSIFTGTSTINCAKTLTFKVSPPKQIAGIISSHSVHCIGENITLFADSFITNQWNTGHTTNTLLVAPLTQSVYTVTGKDLNGCPATATIVIKPEDCTGVNNMEEKRKIVHLSPNPVKDEVTLTLLDNKHDKNTLIVLSIDGRECLREPVTTGNNSINIETLIPGYYFIYLRDGTHSYYIQKLIVSP